MTAPTSERAQAFGEVFGLIRQVAARAAAEHANALTGSNSQGGAEAGGIQRGDNTPASSHP